jgi:hypothetical protein
MPRSKLVLVVLITAASALLVVCCGTLTFQAVLSGSSDSRAGNTDPGPIASPSLTADPPSADPATADATDATAEDTGSSGTGDSAATGNAGTRGATRSGSANVNNVNLNTPCPSEGATAQARNGVLLRCTRTAGDRLRWRKAN